MACPYAGWILSSLIGPALLHPRIARSHVNASGSAQALPISITIRSLQREAIVPNFPGMSFPLCSAYSTCTPPRACGCAREVVNQ